MPGEHLTLSSDDQMKETVHFYYAVMCSRDDWIATETHRRLNLCKSIMGLRGV